MNGSEFQLPSFLCSVEGVLTTTSDIMTNSLEAIENRESNRAVLSCDHHPDILIFDALTAFLDAVVRG